MSYLTYVKSLDLNELEKIFTEIKSNYNIDLNQEKYIIGVNRSNIVNVFENYCYDLRAKLYKKDYLDFLNNTPDAFDEYNPRYYLADIFFNIDYILWYFFQIKGSTKKELPTLSVRNFYNRNYDYYKNSKKASKKNIDNTNSVSDEISTPKPIGLMLPDTFLEAFFESKNKEGVASYNFDSPLFSALFNNLHNSPWYMTKQRAHTRWLPLNVITWLSITKKDLEENRNNPQDIKNYFVETKRPPKDKLSKEYSEFIFKKMSNSPPEQIYLGEIISGFFTMLKVISLYCSSNEINFKIDKETAVTLSKIILKFPNKMYGSKLILDMINYVNIDTSYSLLIFPQKISAYNNRELFSKRVDRLNDFISHFNFSEQIFSFYNNLILGCLYITIKSYLNSGVVSSTEIPFSDIRRTLITPILSNYISDIFIDSTVTIPYKKAKALEHDQRNKFDVDAAYIQKELITFISQN